MSYLYVKPFLKLSLVLATLAFAQDSSPIFLDVSLNAGIHASHKAIWDPKGTGKGYLAVGQAWGDYDQDGFLDLYVTGNLDANVLYRNNGDGSFSISPYSMAVSLPDSISGGAIWADYNNDGWPDLYVLTNGANVLFHNDGGQGFSDVSRQAGVDNAGKGSSASWGDYDGDGFLDLYVVNWSCLPECQPENILRNQDALYRNKGDGSFQDVTGLLPVEKTLGAGFAASFFDYDNDGDSDIYVVNDKMSNPIGNVLWRNDGPGCSGWCWTDASKEAGLDSQMHAMGLALGDYNNDARTDLYISNMMSPMSLQKNLGNGSFADLSAEAEVMVINTNREAVGWGTGFFDFDNDGWQDLYLATTAIPGRAPGMYGGAEADMEDFHRPYPDLLYRNNANGSFSKLADSSISDNHKVSMGFAYADYDNDGRLDFVQGNWNEGYALYQNSLATEHNWLKIHLQGSGTINRDAAGTKVYVTDSKGMTQMQEVILGSSLGSGHDSRLHFGLGSAQISLVEVVWPNGLKQRFSDIALNQIWKLSYVNGQDTTALATDWFRLALDLVKDTDGFTPPVASRAFAYMGISLYEALRPGMPGYLSLAGQLHGLAPLPEAKQSYDWAVVADTALADITKKMFLSTSDANKQKIQALESLHHRRYRLKLEPGIVAASIAYGQAIAQAIYSWSLDDGGNEGYLRNFPEDYQPPSGPGMWLSTPPAYARAMQPSWGTNRPFYLDAVKDCPVLPPLAYSEDPASAFFQEAYEVYQTGLELSAEERNIALFWADDPGISMTPPGHWIAILTSFLNEGGYSLEKTSVAYATLGIALADAFIACWHAKYQYNLIRPISYIQKVIDSSWNVPELTDPVITPPFPEYPSGHSVQSGAAAQVLTDLFGEVSFSDYSHSNRGFEARSFSSFFAAAEEAALSRLYGGIHYRAAIQNGIEQGRCIGEKLRNLRFVTNP